MNKKEYFEINKTAFYILVKIVGLSITVFFSIFFSVTKFPSETIFDSFFVFFICVLIGNGLSLMYIYLFFISKYRVTDFKHKIFNQIDQTIKDKYCFNLCIDLPKNKYSFINYKVFFKYNEILFDINIGQSFKEVVIRIYNRIPNDKPLSYYAINFNKKYKNISVELTGFGLHKIIKSNDLCKLDIIRFEIIIHELIKISEVEKFDLFKIG